MAVNDVIGTENNMVMIGLSKPTTYITEINGKKMRIRATKVVPVVTDKQQPFADWSTEENKATLREVSDYLQTADVEGTIPEDPMRTLTIAFTAEGVTDQRFLASVIQRTFYDVAWECKGETEIRDIVFIEKKTGKFIDVIEKSAGEAAKFGAPVSRAFMLMQMTQQIKPHLIIKSSLLLRRLKT